MSAPLRAQVAAPLGISAFIARPVECRVRAAQVHHAPAAPPAGHGLQKETSLPHDTHDNQICRPQPRTVPMLDAVERFRLHTADPHPGASHPPDHRRPRRGRLCARPAPARRPPSCCPFLQRLGKGQGVRALVVTPTREPVRPDRRGRPGLRQAHRSARWSPSTAALPYEPPDAEGDARGGEWGGRGGWASASQ